MPTFNFIAIAISAFIPLIFGSIWYHPKVMGSAIGNANENSDDAPKGHPPMVYVLTVVLSFLIAMLLAGIFDGHEEAEKTMMHGVFHGGAAAVFMGIPTFMVIALFENKSPKYILIHALYWFISMAIMGGIIGYGG